jgi:O-acetylhomoserine/O-acetylserine sulfhydrylase-like pyridoxal-dependent enzyme
LNPDDRTHSAIPQTKLLYGETLANPRMNILDLRLPGGVRRIFHCDR